MYMYVNVVCVCVCVCAHARGRACVREGVCMFTKYMHAHTHAYGYMYIMSNTLLNCMGTADYSQKTMVADEQIF